MRTLRLVLVGVVLAAWGCGGSSSSDPAVSITISPTTANVHLLRTLQFTATVRNASNGAVTWSVSGADCSGAGANCGSVSGTGLYTAPPAVPSFDEVTVTATSDVDPARSATATVRILSGNAGKLNGAYAFLYQGFALGAPGATAGMFVADGQGHLTYGISDRAWPDAVGGNIVGARFTGTYAIGDDNRGLLSLHSATFGDVTLAFALNAAGTEAFVEPFFDAGTRLLGTLVKLDLAALDNSAITGDYAFQWLGADAAGNRRGALGQLHADGYGAITAGRLNVNDGTSVLEDLSLTGTYSVSGDGRGTMTLVVPTVGTIHLVAYALTKDRFFMLSIDPVSASVPMWSGPALAQDGKPFSNASLQGTGVFDLLGRPAATQARTGIGLLTSDVGCSVSGVLDTNVNGTVATDTPYTGTCSIRPDGRGTLTSATLPPMIFYVVSPGTALLMGAPGAAVDLGVLEPQLPAPYNPTALVGRFAEGASVPPPYDGNLVLTGVVLSDPSGGFTWTLDVVSSTSGLSSGGSTALVSSVGAGGHGVLTDGSGNRSYLYMMSPMSVVVMEGYVPQQAMVDQNLLYHMIR